MKNMGILVSSFLLLGICVSQTVMSATVAVVNSIGEKSEIVLSESDRFVDVLDVVQSYLQTEEGVQGLNRAALELEFSDTGILFRAKKSCFRNYECGYSKQDKEDIKRILTTLARDSLISVASQKSSINRAGDRIDGLHPFCFLMCIFTDEELKCCAHAIRDRGGWVGDGFYEGIVDTLTEECAKDNLYQFVDDFAKKVKIDPQLIRPSLQQQKWMEFTNILIDNIPRENNPNRYTDL